MNSFERLENEACEDGIEVISYHFKSDKIKGLYCNNTIALSKRLVTNAEKNSIMAEELGHHHTTHGDITKQLSVMDQKQEQHARFWAYNKLIGLQGIIAAYKHGCVSLYEMAEFLEVTEEFLNDTLTAYRQKYGCYTTIDNYVIYFEPVLGVLEMI